MSFRTRLTLFFVLIVVLTMVAVGVVVFRLIEDSQAGKRTPGPARSRAPRSTAIATPPTARGSRRTASPPTPRSPEG